MATTTPGRSSTRGQVTTATSYDADGNAYTTQALGFNVFGESLGQIITVPAAQGALGRSYQFKHVYTSNNGLLYSDGYPLGGGLPCESVTHGYATAFDLPNALADTSYGYAQGTTYDAFSRPVQEVVGASGANQASIGYSYDVHTGALTDQLVSRTTATPARVDEEAYSYDEAGTPVRETSTRLGSTTTAETQCYRYDGLDRLTTAWTATDDCTATPSATDSSTVGDPLATASAYWTGWTFTPAGQRGTQVQHATATGGTDTLTTYTHDGNGSDQAHTLTGDTTTGATTGSDTYSYDAAGNMTTRDTAATGSQTLTWNDAGQLTKITAGTTQVGYVYDADGNLLIKTDPTSKTLYLPGEQITLNTTTGTTSGVRYIPLPGGGTAVRTGTGSAYSFEIADPHGTSTLYLDSTAQTPTWRQFTPYGAARAATTTWLDDRGFLNKPTDTTTGLTTVGAREYDPTTGAFISLDPVFEPNDPEQLNGYDYAGDNPLAYTDPDGKMIKDDVTGYGFGNAKNMRDWYRDQGYADGNGKDTKKYRKLRRNYDRSWSTFYQSQYYAYLSSKPELAPEDSGPARQWNVQPPTSGDKRLFRETAEIALPALLLKGYDVAGMLMGRWLSNVGTLVVIDPFQMMKDLSSLRVMVGKEVAKGVSSGDRTFDSGWKSLSVAKQLANPAASHDGAVLNWYYALNGYQYRVRGNVDTNTVTVDIYKRYNWGNVAGGKHRGDLPYLHIPQNSLARLNSVGLAQDFDVWGESSFTMSQ